MIVAKLKLAQILRKMLRTDMDMRAGNAALQLRPEAFDAVDRTAFGGNILANRVVDLFVIKAVHPKCEIGRKFVGVDDGVTLHGFLDDRHHRADAAIRNDLGDEITPTLDHAEHNRFVGEEALFLRRLATDEGFVDLDLFAKATKRRVTIDLPHVFADFVAHAPSRLVGHAKLALDFLGGNTVPRRAEQEHDVEPIAQRCAGAVKGGA